MIEFGEKLKKAREANGYTQQTLADKLFVTRQAVSRWENGARYPELLTAKNISEVLDISLDELLSGEESKLIVENNAVIEKTTIKNTIIALYSTVFMSYFIMLINGAFELKNLCFSGIQEKILSIVTIIGFLIGCVAFCYGLILSLKDKLTPRKTGTVIFLYLITEFVISITARLTYIAQLENINIFISAALIVPYLIGAISAYNYFFKANAGKFWCNLLIVISAYGIVCNLFSSINTIYYMHQGGFPIVCKIISAVLNLAVFTLIIYQSYVLKTKRNS